MVNIWIYGYIYMLCFFDILPGLTPASSFWSELYSEYGAFQWEIQRNMDEH
jgi:hypothetical protein